MAIVACAGERLSARAQAEATVDSVERALSSFRRDTTTASDYSTEGALIEAHYEGAALQRLRATYYGETGRALDDFYYRRDLVSAARTQMRYDQPLTGTVVESTVVRWYVGHDTVWRVPDGSFVAGADARRLSDSLKASANELLVRLTPAAKR